MSGDCSAASHSPQGITVPRYSAAMASARSRERFMIKKFGDATVAQLGHDLFADGAGAEDQRGAAGEFAKNFLGEFYSSGSNRHGARAEFGFRAHALPYFKGGLEHAIEYRAGGALLVREAVGFADLAEDFGFAEQHGIEARGDAE